jgi:hypothetical protein
VLDKEDGEMDIAFQLKTPGVNFDLVALVKVNLMVGFSSLAIIQNKQILC